MEPLWGFELKTSGSLSDALDHSAVESHLIMTPVSMSDSKLKYDIEILDMSPKFMKLSPFVNLIEVRRHAKQFGSKCGLSRIF